MSESGTALLWCVAQVTLVAVATVGIYGLLRRSGPAIRSRVTLAALVVIALLTVAAYSPWPRWHFSRPASTPGAVHEPGSQTTDELNDVDQWHSLNIAELAEPLDSGVDASPEHVSASVTNSPAQETVASASSTEMTALSRDDSRTSDAGGSIWERLTARMQAWFASVRLAGSGWTLLVAAVFLCALACGLSRLLAGWLAVAGYRRRAVAIDDAGLLALVHELKQKLECRKSVEVRESAAIVSPATVGARRPLVLLPPGWRSWNAPQLRAVMAHELAHIARNDFMSWIVAQIAVVLHFYHPLVHWLASRLRLDQELAADAAAAPHSGGRERYLGILAEMALAGSSRNIGWPARAFLPGRGTLIKRIERLRDEAASLGSSSMIVQSASICVILLAGVAVAGLRDAGDKIGSQSSELFAQADDSIAVAESSARPVAVLDATYVPIDARVVVSLKPSSILAGREMKPLAEFLRESPVFNEMGFPVNSIEEMIAIPFRSAASERDSRRGKPLLAFGTTIIRTKDSNDFKTLAEQVVPDAEKRTWRRQEYLAGKSDGNADPMCLYRPDDRTVILDHESGLKEIIETSQRRTSRLIRSDAWQTVRRSQLAVAIDGRWLNELIDSPRGPAAALRGSAVELGALSPLWEDADVISAGINIDDKLGFRGSVNCPDQAGAEQVADTLTAFITLARNAAGRYRDEINRSAPPQVRQRLLPFVDLGDELVHTAKVTRLDDTVTLTATAEFDQTFTLLALQRLKSTARSSRQADSKRNLKMIGIAMHNYHDVHGRFPDTVMLGPDGKTPHSWRVALLPYLGHKDLFAAYRLNEPWDSPHNQEVLKHMPPEFRHPAAPANSTYASYLALAGPSTVFQGAEGIRIRDVTDGTSNTILIVEAKREIPWTKPEDIPFDVAQDPPKLGGFVAKSFLALLCDGRVVDLPLDTPPHTLKAWATPAGGEVVGSPSRETSERASRLPPP